MDLVVDLGVGVLVLVLLVGALAVWRISQVTSWRALAVTARATGSFAECVAFIRFCAEEEAISYQPSAFSRRRHDAETARRQAQRFIVSQQLIADSQ
jgi:hypothetical protein